MNYRDRYTTDMLDFQIDLLLGDNYYAYNYHRNKKKKIDN